MIEDKIIHIYVARKFDGHYKLLCTNSWVKNDEPVYSPWGTGRSRHFVSNGTTATCNTCLEKFIQKKQIEIDKLNNRLRSLSIVTCEFEKPILSIVTCEFEKPINKEFDAT